jgi:hypothetical protein
MFKYATQDHYFSTPTVVIISLVQALEGGVAGDGGHLGLDGVAVLVNELPLALACIREGHIDVLSTLSLDSLVVLVEDSAAESRVGKRANLDVDSGELLVRPDGQSLGGLVVTLEGANDSGVVSTLLIAQLNVDLLELGHIGLVNLHECVGALDQGDLGGSEELPLVGVWAAIAEGDVEVLTASSGDQTRWAGSVEDAAANCKVGSIPGKDVDGIIWSTGTDRTGAVIDIGLGGKLARARKLDNKSGLGVVGLVVVLRQSHGASEGGEENERVLHLGGDLVLIIFLGKK